MAKIPVWADKGGQRKSVVIDTEDPARSIENLKKLFWMVSDKPKGCKSAVLERCQRRYGGC